MLLFLPIFLLALTLAALTLASRIRSTSRTFWLIATSGAFITWLSTFYLRARLPLSHVFSYWHTNLGPELQLEWQLDQISWPFVFAVVSLLIAAQLTEVRQAAEKGAFSWATYILLSLASILALMAGNLLALLLAWTLLDVLILLLQMILLRESPDLRQSVISFSVSILGSLLILWAYISHGSTQLGPPSVFPQEANILLILAAGLRLGILPLNPAILKKTTLPLTTSTLFRITQVTAATALLARFETPLLIAGNGLLILAFLAALYTSFKWVLAENEHSSLGYWVATSAALILVAAIEGKNIAAQSWGLALIFGGAFLFLAHAGKFAKITLLIIGVLLLVGLPFTISNGGLTLFSSPNSNFVYLFFFPLSLAILGWLRLARKIPLDEVYVERWEASIFALGIFLLPVALLALGLGLAPALSPAQLSSPAWPLLVLLFMISGLFLLAHRAPLLPHLFSSRFETLFSLNWLYRFAFVFLQKAADVLRLISRLLEGRAGVLWAVLMVALLLSVITQLAVSG